VVKESHGNNLNAHGISVVNRVRRREIRLAVPPSIRFGFELPERGEAVYK
jgi:hypothetical protein